MDGATKPPNKTSGEALAARFRGFTPFCMCAQIALINRQDTKVKNHGDTKKLFLYLDPRNGDQAKLQCDPIMPM